MSPASARALLDLTHRQLVHWAADVMAEAELHTLAVRGDFPPAGEAAASGASLVLYPYRLVPWPKRVESAPPTRMLHQRAPAAFPGAWATIARGLSTGLEQVLPRTAAGQLVPRPEVDTLPAPLADWYREQGAPWLVSDDGRARALLPSLGWRNPFVVRVYYLALASQPPGSATPGVSALGALAVAVNDARTLSVLVPPSPEARAVSDFAAALAACLPDRAARDALAQAALDIGQPASWPLTLVPFPDIDHEDVAALMRALRQPLQPVLHMAVQVPLGAGPAFEPAFEAQVSARPLPRDAGGAP